MPKTTLLHARVDTTRKTKAEKILARYGLTPAQAINVFYAKVIEVGGLPFDLRPTETDELLVETCCDKPTLPQNRISDEKAPRSIGTR